MFVRYLRRCSFGGFRNPLAHQRPPSISIFIVYVTGCIFKNVDLTSDDPCQHLPLKYLQGPVLPDEYSALSGSPAPIRVPMGKPS